MSKITYNWVKVAPIPPNGKALIPEHKVVKIVVQGKTLFFTNCNGKYYAGENKCPHAGAAMHTGWIDDKNCIVCPYHRFEFNLETGQGTDGFYLPTYPVEVKEDGVYVGFPVKKWWQFF